MHLVDDVVAVNGGGILIDAFWVEKEDLANVLHGWEDPYHVVIYQLVNTFVQPLQLVIVPLLEKTTVPEKNQSKLVS